MIRLTDRQQEVLSYIQNELNRTGIIPSTREIQAFFGFASQTAAMNHLRALEKKGMIRRKPGLARAVIVERKSRIPNSFDLPLLGAIPAGMAVDAAEIEAERVAFEPSLVGIQASSSSFALRVTGDSMEGAHILDGDLAVLERRPARDGDIVAALIDGEVTLKRLMVSKGHAFLKAENPRYPDLMPAHGLEVQGVLTGVVRKLRAGRNR